VNQRASHHHGIIAGNKPVKHDLKRPDLLAALLNALQIPVKIFRNRPSLFSPQNIHNRYVQVTFRIIIQLRLYLFQFPDALSDLPRDLRRDPDQNNQRHPAVFLRIPQKTVPGPAG